MKTMQEWKALLDQANERQEPLYVTPDELAELRALEAEQLRERTFTPLTPDWHQLLGVGRTEVVVDRFAVERRMGASYKNLVQRVAEMYPWVSDGVHTCVFCGQVVLYSALFEDMLSVSKSHTPECIWRQAQELVGYTGMTQGERYLP